MSSSIGDTHSRAMELADEGLELRRQGRHVEAFSKFREASWLESQAADEISSELQPGHGVLHRSAAILALDANRIDEAARLIDAGLASEPVESVREELEDLRELVTPVDIATRLTPSPAAFLQHTLVALSCYFPEMRVEAAESGRLVQRVAELPLGACPPLFVYRSQPDLVFWKDLALDTLPARLRLSIAAGDVGDYPRFVVETYGSADVEMARAVKDILDAPPESFDFQVPEPRVTQ